MASEQPLLCTPAYARDIERAVRMILTIGGTAVTKGPDFLSINIPQAARERGQIFPDPPSIPVTLLVQGGIAGANKSSSATFTYDAYHAVDDPEQNIPLNDSPVSLTGMGNGWRALLLMLESADYGWGYFDSDGDFVLTMCDECPAGEQDCET